MSGLSGVGGNAQVNVFNAARSQAPAAAARSLVRDADGDHDGTAPGQFDAKDMGKGMSFDKRA